MLLYVWGLAHVVRKGKKPFFHTPSYVERTEAFSLPFSKKKKIKKIRQYAEQACIYQGHVRIRSKRSGAIHSKTDVLDSNKNVVTVTIFAQKK